ncbi:MAG: hypothetical protein K9M49_03525 [Candidatus Marinimicrobia bacterium]|nr:hypothetical protein [Candidatus Neomarinimicrobiota bacterium]MCF7851371.1 hypothetical protein [Candidatus Neomarinimicrobiota bacterium]MCF7904205.1 hypothetical protein [Candidatus Neomarinimicrobiota bacterium]
MVVLLVIGFTLIAIGVSSYLGMRRYEALSVSPIATNSAYQLKVQDMNIPDGIYFSPTHSWTHLETSGMARVGVDAFIQGLTGVLSSIRVPEKGSVLKQGDPLFNIIHEGKSLEISAPISGKVKNVNIDALQNMRMVHNDPYAYGWLVEMEPENWEADTQRLYLGQKTKTWLKTEISRIRDFFAYSFAPQDAEAGTVVFQEGGDIAECALAFSGKGLWGSFQTHILNEANSELTA